MDRVGGFEPTTSAFSNSALYYLLSKEQQSKRDLIVQIPPAPDSFLYMLLAYIIRQAKFFEKARQCSKTSLTQGK
jgi:hypothetical protein